MRRVALLGLAPVGACASKAPDPAWKWSSDRVESTARRGTASFASARSRCMRARLLVAIAAAACVGRTTSEVPDLEGVPHPEMFAVRPSLVPGAGLGLFAVERVPSGTYIGPYTGEYLVPKAAAPDVTYLFQLPECARDETHDRIVGDPEHYVSKVNFAPDTINGRHTGLLSATFWTYCEEPYVRLFSDRAIAPGEEVYTDYGPDYDYAFMDRPEVQQHFLRVAGVPPSEAFAWTRAE